MPPPEALILLVEDNPADVDLFRESLSDNFMSISLSVAANGEEAVDYLFNRGRHVDADRPQLILLDLNLPGLNGKQVLSQIKSNGKVRNIPVVVLSSSSAERDIVDSYDLGASCYLIKPLDFEAYRKTVRAIEDFWFSVAKLPARNTDQRDS